MTISPYDSLPSGNNDITPKTITPESAAAAPIKYVDVEPTPPPAPIVEAPPTKAPAPVPHKMPAPAQPQPPVKTIPMDPPPQYSDITVRNLQGCCEFILPFEESLLVPDTMPDMQKVLFADGKVDLAQPMKTSYDRNDFLAGDITAYTIYRPVPASVSPAAGPAAYNDCPVDVVRSIIPFKTDKCWGNAAGDSFKPAVSIRTINAEMINERKFIVKGELLIKIHCIADRRLKLFRSAADDSLVTLDDKVKATSLDHETSDTIEISQEITIRDGQPSPVKLLKTSMTVSENHRQLTSGKLVINASIHLDALYMGEANDGEKKLCSLSNKTDFTQFIVMDDSTDMDLICIDFGSGDLSLTIESKDKFMLQGKVTSLIRSYRTKEIDMIRDAYHKKKDLVFDQASEEISCVKGTVTGEISAREVVDLSGNGKTPAALLCGSCFLPSITSLPDKERIVIEGSLPVKILALDEENTPFVIEHTVPIRGALSHSAEISDGSQVSIDIDTSVKEFWFSEINSRQLEVNTVLTISVWLTAKEEFSIIDDLRFAEKESLPSRTSMALYVADSGDTLWDIAKRYKTDMASIASLNEIEPDKPLPVGAKLFIAK